MKKFSILLFAIFLLIAPNTSSAYTDTTSATQSNVVNTLSNAGIIMGYPDKTFKPNQEITRAQVAAIITRSVTLPSVRPAKTFTDLPTTHYFYNNIQQLYRAGIIDGFNNQFFPDQPIKRGDLAKILSLTFDLDQSNTSKFPDVTNHWANEFIGALVTANITRGYQDGTFKPENYVTRGEFAYFIYRALYGAEPIIDSINVDNLTRYQPRYLDYIAYEVFELNHAGDRDVSYDYIEQDGTIFPNGLLSFNFRDDAFLYGINSSDFIFGEVLAPLRAGYTVEQIIDIGWNEPDYATFRTTLTYVDNFRIKAGSFDNVSKVVVTASYFDLVEIFYFKEGYGLLKHEYSGSSTRYETKVLYELIDFRLK